MPLKTISRLGLMLLGVLLLVRGLSALCLYLTSTLACFAFERSRFGFYTQPMNLTYSLLAILVPIGIAVYLLSGGRRLLARIALDNRRRCTECDYRLDGHTTLRCPECGTAVVETARAAEPSTIGRAWKPFVRALVRVVGVAVLALSLDDFLYSCVYEGNALYDTPSHTRLYGVVWVSKCLIVLAIGIYMLMGGPVVVNWLVAKAQQSDPDDAGRRVDSGDDGFTAANAGGDEHDVPKKASPWQPADPFLVAILMRLTGVFVLVVASDIVCPCVSFVASELVGLFKPSDFLSHLPIVLWLALEIGMGVYMIAGGRWLSRRLLAHEISRSTMGRVRDPERSAEWASQGDSSHVDPRRVTERSGEAVLRRSILRMLLILLGAFLVATYLPEALGRLLVGAIDAINLNASSLLSFWLDTFLPKAMGAALGLYLSLGRRRLVDRIAGCPPNRNATRPSDQRPLPQDTAPGEPMVDAIFSQFAAGIPKVVERQRPWVALLLRVLATWFCVDAIATICRPVSACAAALLGRSSGGDLWFEAGLGMACLFQLAVGIYLLFRGRWVLDKIIPLDRPHCPACGYPITEDVEGVCPECDAAVVHVEQTPNVP